MTVDITPETLAEYGEVFETLEHILSVVEQTFAAANVDLPDRRFIAVGDVGGAVAVDCEQVNVNFIKSYTGEPGQPETRASGCMMMLSGDFVVQVWRCVPKPETGRGRTEVIPPRVPAVNASTKIQAVDAGILLQSAWSMRSAQGHKATAAPTGQTGGFQAVQLDLSISLSRGD